MTDAERKEHIERLRQKINLARLFASPSVIDALDMIVDLLEEPKP